MFVVTVQKQITITPLILFLLILLYILVIYRAVCLFIYLFFCNRTVTQMAQAPKGHSLNRCCFHGNAYAIFNLRAIIYFKAWRPQF